MIAVVATGRNIDIFRKCASVFLANVHFSFDFMGIAIGLYEHLY
jgi:hypothetical protein